MLLGSPVLELDEAKNLLAAVRGSRLVMVTVETAGIITGPYALFGGVALRVNEAGDAGESMVGDAGDSKVGEAGESITGEAGDSTIVNAGASIIKRDGESMSGESGGARRGESSSPYFLQDGSGLSLDTETLCFFFAGSSSAACIWPLGKNNKTP